MPTHKSAEKRVRQNAKRKVRNKSIRSRLTTYTREFTDLLEEGDVDGAAEKIRKVEAEYDRAASKGVVPKKRASRKISRLKKRLHSAQTAE